jgi:hypothetical protein
MSSLLCATIGNSVLPATRRLSSASSPQSHNSIGALPHQLGDTDMTRRYITVTALIERDHRNRRLARVAATVAGAGLALAILALPIGWMLTW